MVFETQCERLCIYKATLQRELNAPGVISPFLYAWFPVATEVPFKEDI